MAGAQSADGATQRPRGLRAWWQALPLPIRVIVVLVLVIVVILALYVLLRWLNHSKVAILWDPTDSMENKQWFGSAQNVAYAQWLKDCCVPRKRHQIGDDDVASYHLLAAPNVYAPDVPGTGDQSAGGRAAPSVEPSSDYVTAIRSIAADLQQGYARRRFLIVIGDLIEQRHRNDIPRLPLPPPPTPTPDEQQLLRGATVILIHPVGHYPLTGVPADFGRYPDEWVEWWRTYFAARGCPSQRVLVRDFPVAPGLLGALGLWRGEAPGRPELDSQ